MKLIVGLVSLFIAASLVGATVASAQPVPASPPSSPAERAYDRCLDQASSTTAQQQCGTAFLLQEERLLSAAWRQIEAGFSAPQRVGLLAEQRAWIAYKDRSCLIFNDPMFGSMGAASGFANCRGQVIRQRIERLEGYLAEN